MGSHLANLGVTQNGVTSYPGSDSGAIQQYAQKEAQNIPTNTAQGDAQLPFLKDQPITQAMTEPGLLPWQVGQFPDNSQPTQGAVQAKSANAGAGGADTGSGVHDMPSVLGFTQHKPASEPTLTRPSFLQAATSGPGGTPNALSPGLTKGGKLLSFMMSGLKGAAAGAGDRKFNEGFSHATELPFLQAQRGQALQHGALENTLLQQQTAPWFLQNKRDLAQADLAEKRSAANKNRYDVNRQGDTIDLQAEGGPAVVSKGTPPPITNAAELALAVQTEKDPAKKAQLQAALTAVNTPKQVDNETQLYRDTANPDPAVSEPARKALQLKQQNQMELANNKADNRPAPQDHWTPVFDLTNGNLTGRFNSKTGESQKLDPDSGKFVTGQASKGVSQATTTDRLKRSDLANNAISNIAAMREVVGRRSDLFGKVAGRYTSFSQMMGSDDPDIQRLGVEGHNFALASNGAHGIRSQEAIRDTENELFQHFRVGAGAFAAGLTAAQQSLGTFVEAAKHGKQPGPDAATQGTANKPNKYSGIGAVPIGK